MRLCLAVLALGLMAGPASAASFDCAKAETPLEDAICASSDLSKADEDMAQAFATARKALSKPASAVVLDGQRLWIDYAARACTQDGEPMESGSYNDDGIACLTNIFTNRANALGQIGARDEFVLYSVDSYSTAPDPDPESWVKVATTDISYVQIDGDDAEAEAFNAFVQELADRSAAPPSDGEAGTTDTSLGIGLKSATPELISLAINDYMYGHGAAHGNYGITYAHFLRGEQRGLGAEDVFAGSDWAVELTPQIVERLKSDALAATGDAEAIWADLTDLEQVIADPARWDIQAEGIGFQFEPYEVSAYAYGAPEAVMSWDELDPWLAPGARELLVGG